MSNLKEAAQAYEPKQTLNIADLDKVDLTMDMKLEDKEGKDENDKTYTYQVMIINDMSYRVPGSVLEKIKEMLELKPDLRYVNVEKTGSGLATRYSVKKVE